MLSLPESVGHGTSRKKEQGGQLAFRKQLRGMRKQSAADKIELGVIMIDVRSAADRIELRIDELTRKCRHSLEGLSIGEQHRKAFTNGSRCLCVSQSIDVNARHCAHQRPRRRTVKQTLVYRGLRPRGRSSAGARRLRRHDPLP